MQAPILANERHEIVPVWRQCPDVEGLTIPMEHVDSITLDVDCPRKTLGHKLEKAARRLCDRVRSHIKIPGRKRQNAASPDLDPEKEKLLGPRVRIMDTRPPRKPRKRKLTEREKIIEYVDFMSACPV